MSGSRDCLEGKAQTSSQESSRSIDKELVSALKHIDTFYEKPPPGLFKESEEERPEDCIPNTPQNQAARDFLAKAPTRGLWMPLGKEVKVMQCWRCKNYGHRTGDKECPLFLQGNPTSERFRYVHEDPMFNYVNETLNKEKMERVNKLKALLEESDSESSSSVTSKSSSSNSSSSSSSPVRNHKKMSLSKQKGNKSSQKDEKKIKSKKRTHKKDKRRKKKHKS